MQPNFEEMSTPELKAYVLSHRNNIEAVRILFSRRSPDSEATIYPPVCTEEGVPIEENIRTMQEAIARKIKQEKT